jgi:hypothetical protein
MPGSSLGINRRQGHPALLSAGVVKSVEQQKLVVKLKQIRHYKTLQSI